MRNAMAAVLVVLALAACTPRAEGPDAVVREVYATASAAIERGEVPYDYIPMTAELSAAIAQGSALAEQRNEPFIEGDLATGCQDCQTLTDLVINVTTPPADGRAVVEANFATDGRPRTMVFDMRQTPEGWRVDNISSPDGYDLRSSVAGYNAEASLACVAERGEAPAQLLADQCRQVSPATHPPCNVANACAMMEAEIERACQMLDAAQRPTFCPRPPAE
jgi:hypothetical protein